MPMPFSVTATVPFFTTALAKPAPVAFEITL
jgi:hypothetical protein